jgi:hypothetical protein
VIAARVLRLGLAGLAACGLLAGCVSIPGDGPVLPAGKVADDRGRVDYRAVGPSMTDGPADTVHRFIEAARDYLGDHSVARKFLLPAPGPRLKWRPESPVVVFSSLGDVRLGGAGSTATPSAPASATPTPEQGDTAVVTATVSVHARINASGEYTLARTGEQETRTFELTYTADGWRISTLVNGILLSQTWFGEIYRSMPVYFPDRQGAYLVPDMRWFPAGIASTPSVVVSTVLGGPASWLTPAVENVVPKNTQPTVSGVKVAGGVATVDLTREVRETDSRQRQILKRQFDATLTGDQQVVPASSVVVTVEQQVLEAQPTRPAGDGARGGNPGPAQLRSPPDDVNPPVALDAKGGLVQLIGREVRPIAGLAALASPTNSHPAAEPGGTAYAVLAADRTKLMYAVPAGAAPRQVLGGRSLTQPSFDPFGWLWTAQEQAKGLVWTAMSGQHPTSLAVDWLADARVRSLRISREGARAVLVLATPGKPAEVVVCAVTRDVDGRPTGLGPPQRLLAEAVDATSASWMDPSHVVALARKAGQTAPVPWVVEIGGDVESTLPAPGAVSVTVDPQEQMWVTLANGAVQHRSISSWEAVPGVRFAMLPG